ncbi:DNA (cytosine-5)-methyltransferase 1 [Lysobacter sp. OAE881]|uniref:DNA cytosine methyltransferase n=1 Tax=Lysobacter sp. OAE881 TaxID=2663813 RepID=UPI00178B3FC1
MAKSGVTLDVFDFFSGCGGTSCGFALAGMNIKFALDFDHEASSTFAANFPDAVVMTQDIRQLKPQDLSSIVGRRQRPLLFSGCAPCQPFSKQNLSKSSKDSRRSLLGEFGRFVEHWLPEYVFIENVPGLQRIQSKDGPLSAFVRLLRRLGYDVKTDVLPASAYGVPQTRQRLVLLASLVGDIELPARSHGEKLTPTSTVRHWIEDLAPIEAGQVHPDDPDHHSAVLTDINLKRIRATPEGGGRESWPQDLWLQCHVGHEGHKDVYGRLSWDRPASGLTTRCISYSNGRFGHPEQDRGLSVREAACLQTFPRSFRFHGSLSSKAKQVGNAVPPLMAKAFADQIRRHWQLRQQRIPGKRSEPRV